MQTLAKGHYKSATVLRKRWSVRDLFAAARPRHWTKNLVCLSVLLFSGFLLNLDSAFKALIGFFCFCLASSAVYVFNDILDRQQDRVHPSKRLRPVASGRLAVGPALLESLVLLMASISLSFILASSFRWVLAAFLALNLLYCVALKRLVIIDVVAIGVGFVLRVQSGIEAIRAPQSGWILLCMFFMALFLGFGKRRGEIINLQGDRRWQRPVLQAYSVPFLDLMLMLSAATSLACYSLYAVTEQTNEAFLLTILPVAFALARYLLLVMSKAGGEGPEEMLTRDPSLILAILIWASLCVAVLYFGLHIFPS